jgi:hypothetical protein
VHFRGVMAVYWKGKEGHGVDLADSGTFVLCLLLGK